MTTATNLPRPSRSSATIRSFASVLLFTVVALFMAAPALAQSPAFSAAELRDLKFGIESSTSAPSPAGFSHGELQDLRGEARSLATPTFTIVDVFDVTRSELADLRAEVRDVSIPVATAPGGFDFTAAELADLRYEAAHGPTPVSSSPSAEVTAEEQHDLRAEARGKPAMFAIAGR